MAGGRVWGRGSVWAVVSEEHQSPDISRHEGNRARCPGAGACCDWDKRRPGIPRRRLHAGRYLMEER